jgi:hypothetical protein
MPKRQLQTTLRRVITQKTLEFKALTFQFNYHNFQDVFNVGTDVGI